MRPVWNRRIGFTFKAYYGGFGPAPDGEHHCFPTVFHCIGIGVNAGGGGHFGKVRACVEYGAGEKINLEHSASARGTFIIGGVKSGKGTVLPELALTGWRPLHIRELLTDQVKGNLPGSFINVSQETVSAISP